MDNHQILTEQDFKPREASPRPRVVKFVNFSKTPFTWTWNKIPYTFLPGEANAKFMERSIALHFAKHLVNRELLARGRESDTSPRKPEENPYFMELFKKCIFEVDAPTGPVDQTKLEQDAIDRNMKQALGVKTPAAKTSAKKTTARKTTEPAAEPSPAEIARMTGQSEHKPTLNNKPASEADKDFEVIEPEDDGDDD